MRSLHTERWGDSGVVAAPERLDSNDPVALTNLPGDPFERSTRTAPRARQRHRQASRARAARLGLLLGHRPARRPSSRLRWCPRHRAGARRDHHDRARMSRRGDLHSVVGATRVGGRRGRPLRTADHHRLPHPGVNCNDSRRGVTNAPVSGLPEHLRSTATACMPSHGDRAASDRCRPRAHATRASCSQ